MTTTDTPKTAAEYDREWLTHYLPLPTVDDVAGPIVRAVLDLHNLVEVGEALPRLVLAEIVDREVVTEWISTVRQVIELVTVMAGPAAPPGNGNASRLSGRCGWSWRRSRGGRTS
jgi:hypothetical protein